MAKAQKKTTTRTSKSARAGERRKGGVSLAAAAGMFTVRGEGALLAVIRPKNTKHGPRQRRRAHEYAQIAIQALYGANPPKHANVVKLTDTLNKWLKTYPDFLDSGLAEISRYTVTRVLEMMHAPK
jgi:hypothetical protein